MELPTQSPTQSPRQLLNLLNLLKGEKGKPLNPQPKTTPRKTNSPKSLPEPGHGNTRPGTKKP